MQSAHACIDFQHQHPDIASKWNKESNYLVFLSVPNESELERYIERFKEHNLKHTVFREPDIGNQITAVAVEPCELSKKICSRLSLTLKNAKP